METTEFNEAEGTPSHVDGVINTSNLVTARGTATSVVSASPLPAASRTISHEELWQQLSNAASQRSAEDSVLWSKFGTFWATHAILLVALFSSGKLPDRTVGIVLGGFGMLISIVWYAMQGRTLLHIERYEKVIARIEEEYLNIPRDIVLSPSLLDPEVSPPPKGLPVRVWMRRCGIGSGLLWLLAFLYFAVQR